MLARILKPGLHISDVHELRFEVGCIRFTRYFRVAVGLQVSDLGKKEFGAFQRSSLKMKHVYQIHWQKIDGLTETQTQNQTDSL